MRSRRQAFTLLELLLVVMILAIICAMALPGLINARLAANEASAIASLKHVARCSQQYRIRFGAYAGALSDLEGAGYIDDSLGDAVKSGYTFSYTQLTEGFTCNADPVAYGSTGFRYFFVDESGVVRFNTSTTAASTDAAID